MRQICLAAALVLSTLAPTPASDERLDLATLAKIRDEGLPASRG